MGDERETERYCIHVAGKGATVGQGLAHPCLLVRSSFGDVFVRLRGWAAGKWGQSHSEGVRS